MVKAYKTKKPEETEALGETLGRRLGVGDLVLLFGDLGSGKTTFVKGLARGVGVPEDTYVVSPSFSLVNEYQGRIPLYHVDLYRLDPEEVEDLGIWDALSKGAMVVEWAERIVHPPKARFRVYFSYLSEKEREVRIEEEKDDGERGRSLEELDRDEGSP